MMQAILKKLENTENHSQIIETLNTSLDYLEIQLKVFEDTMSHPKKTKTLTKNPKSPKKNHEEKRPNYKMYSILGLLFNKTKSYIETITKYNTENSKKKIKIKKQNKRWQKILSNMQTEKWQYQWTQTAIICLSQCKAIDEFINPITLYLCQINTALKKTIINIIQDRLNGYIADSAQELKCDFLQHLIKNRGNIIIQTNNEESDQLNFPTFLSEKNIDNTNKIHYASFLKNLLANTNLIASDYIALFDFLQKKIIIIDNEESNKKSILQNHSINTKTLKNLFTELVKTYFALVCGYSADQKVIEKNIAEFYQRLTKQKCIINLRLGESKFEQIYTYIEADKKFIEFFLNYNKIIYLKNEKRENQKNPSVKSASCFLSNKTFKYSKNFYKLLEELTTHKDLAKLAKSQKLIKEFLNTPINKFLIEKSNEFKTLIDNLVFKSATTIWDSMTTSEVKECSIENIRIIINLHSSLQCFTIKQIKEKDMVNYAKLLELFIGYAEKAKWKMVDYQAIIKFLDGKTFESIKLIKTLCMQIASNYIKFLLENKLFLEVSNIFNQQYVFPQMQIFSQKEMYLLIENVIQFQLLVITPQDTFQCLYTRYHEFNQHPLIALVLRSEMLRPEKIYLMKKCTWELTEYKKFFENFFTQSILDHIEIPNLLQTNLLDIVINYLKFLLTKENYLDMIFIFNEQNLQKIIPQDLLFKTIQDNGMRLSPLIAYIIDKKVINRGKLIDKFADNDEQKQLYKIIEVLSQETPGNINPETLSLSKITNHQKLIEILKFFWIEKSSEYIHGLKLELCKKIYSHIFTKLPKVKTELTNAIVDLLYQQLSLTSLGNEETFKSLNANVICNHYTFIHVYGDDQQRAIIEHLFYNQLSSIYLCFGIKECGPNYKHLQCYQFIRKIHAIFSQHEKLFSCNIDDHVSNFVKKNKSDDDYYIIPTEKEDLFESEFKSQCLNEYCKIFGHITTQLIFIIDFVINTQQNRQLLLYIYDKIAHGQALKISELLNNTDENFQSSMSEKYYHAQYGHKKEIIEIISKDDAFGALDCFIKLVFSLLKLKKQNQVQYNQYLKDLCFNFAKSQIPKQLQKLSKYDIFNTNAFKQLKQFLPEEHFIISIADYINYFLEQEYDKKSHQQFLNFYNECEKIEREQNPEQHNKHLKKLCCDFVTLQISEKLKKISKYSLFSENTFIQLKQFLPEEHFIISIADYINYFLKQKYDEKLHQQFLEFYNECEKIENDNNFVELIPLIDWLTKIKHFPTRQSSVNLDTIQKISQSLPSEFVTLCQNTIPEFCEHLKSCEEPPILEHCQNLLKLCDMCSLSNLRSLLEEHTYDLTKKYFNSLFPELTFSSIPNLSFWKKVTRTNMLPILSTPEFAELKPRNDTNENTKSFLHQIFICKKIQITKVWQQKYDQLTYFYHLTQLIIKFQEYVKNSGNQNINTEISFIITYIENNNDETQKLLLPDRLLYLIEKNINQWKKFGDDNEIMDKDFVTNRLPNLLKYYMHLYNLLNTLNIEQPGNYKSMLKQLDKAIHAIADRCYKTWRDMLTRYTENGKLKTHFQGYIVTKTFLIDLFEQKEYIKSSAYKKDYLQKQKTYNSPDKEQKHTNTTDVPKHGFFL